MASRRRAMIEDGLLAAFLTVLAQYELLDAHSASEVGQGAVDTVGPYPFDVVLVGATTLAVAFRRRWPAALPAVVFGGHVVANVALAHALPFFGCFGALMVLAYTSGRWASLTNPALARLGWIAPAAWAATFWLHNPGARDVLSIAFQAGMLMAPWLTAWTISRLQDQRAALKSALARLSAAEDERRRTALLEERTRIAREMHDVLTHGVSVMVVQAGAARTSLPDTGADEARTSLFAIERAGRQVLGELRRTVGLLRREGEADPHGPSPGLAELPDLVAAMSSAGLDVQLDVNVVGEVDPGRGLAVYRIVQEALTNALRHAGPTRTRVRVTGGPELVVEVVDAGSNTRLSARPSGGNGLTGMRERVALYNGALSAGPHGPGFRVQAEIPAEVT